jgi:hypothetical protein
MSSNVPTPTVDELRARGAWSPDRDKFAEWDPDWVERCMRMTNNPWMSGEAQRPATAADRRPSADKINTSWLH